MMRRATVRWTIRSALAGSMKYCGQGPRGEAGGGQRTPPPRKGADRPLGKMEPMTKTHPNTDDVFEWIAARVETPIEKRPRMLAHLQSSTRKQTKIPTVLPSVPNPPSAKGGWVGQIKFLQGFASWLSLACKGPAWGASVSGSPSMAFRKSACRLVLRAAPQKGGGVSKTCVHAPACVYIYACVWN